MPAVVPFASAPPSPFTAFAVAAAGGGEPGPGPNHALPGRARPFSTSARTLRWSWAAWSAVAAAEDDVLFLLGEEDQTKLPAPPRPVRAMGISGGGTVDVAAVVVLGGLEGGVDAALALALPSAEVGF